MENITGMIGAFIAISIMLTIGISILDNTSSDCKTRTGYDATTSTGWAATCEDTNDQTQSSYGLLTLTLFVLAAVAVVGIVRFLG